MHDPHHGRSSRIQNSGKFPVYAVSLRCSADGDLPYLARHRDCQNQGPRSLAEGLHFWETGVLRLSQK